MFLINVLIFLRWSWGQKEYLALSELSSEGKKL